MIGTNLDGVVSPDFAIIIAKLQWSFVPANSVFARD
jgi:hypothetical protein